jgi:glutamyl-tRNA synthetase
MKIITRFAPSPTGKLHIGNARIALLNFLYTRKYGGQFILRIDNTDRERSKKEFEDLIKKDLKWLGLDWDIEFDQNSRVNHYEDIKQKLIEAGDLYPCYETQQELEIKRKSLLSRSLPPIYDRASLKLSKDEIERYKEQGLRPHYRYKIKDRQIMWNDMIKEEVKYESKYLSDPILIREDGTMTYMLCSTIDDVDYGISHVIRGEDHITNTAIQIQLFHALGATPPTFAHLGLIKTKASKISKREGGFDIESLRENENFEPISICNFLSSIGTSKNVTTHTNLKFLIEEFDINIFSKNSTIYEKKDIEIINEKIINNLTYQEVYKKLKNAIGIDISEEFWQSVKHNIKRLNEVKIWWDICYNFKIKYSWSNEYLEIAKSILPEGNLDNQTWKKWTEALKEKTNKTGKDLYLPLRLALTGMESGPELSILLPMIGREEIVRRLS